MPILNLFALRKKNCVMYLNLIRESNVDALYLWGSKIWARDPGPGTTFHQQYARGEEITEDRCN